MTQRTQTVTRRYPFFVSLVWVVRNRCCDLAPIADNLSESLASTFADHELIIVDNGSTDKTIEVLKSLTAIGGLPNIQAYCLVKEVESDSATIVGLENALGDFVVVLDPDADSVSMVSQMMESASVGADVVFARNLLKARQGWLYEFLLGLFTRVSKIAFGVDLLREAPHFRMLSRRIVNFILQHPQADVAYRYIPATAGFAQAHLEYAEAPRRTEKFSLRQGISKGVRLLTSSTRLPMRLVTSLSLFGAASNLAYSCYVILVAMFKTHVAEGWVSLSLQQSGMFFLISLVLLVLGEYIANMTSSASGGPTRYVAQEFTSAHITRREKLNIEVPTDEHREPAKPR